MCGMHFCTRSPSSRRTSRRTPWVAGCWGPMLMSIESPSRPDAISPISSGPASAGTSSMPSPAPGSCPAASSSSRA